jgi:hypothetical protein
LSSAFIASLLCYDFTLSGEKLSHTTKRRKEEELEERLKDHYYYHCQMNPEGFKRLMLENLEKMEKDSIANEAESLKTGKR